MDANKKPLTDIISYSDQAYISLQLKNSPQDTQVKDLEIRLWENKIGDDLLLQRTSILSNGIDEEGYIVPHPVNMERITNTKQKNQSKTLPRFFYIQLCKMKDNKVDKIIYTYPEGYKTGKDNDSEIVELQKDDYRGEDIKNQLGYNIDISSGRLMHNWEERLKPIFDESKFYNETAEQRNKDAQITNTATLDKSKNYFLQLKVAEDPSQQKSRYYRTGKQVGQAGGGVGSDCGGKYCITKDNYKSYQFGTPENVGKLIQEINIRLAGFGGNLPTTEFDKRTEDTIKQFQRDYMGITPTGKICGSLLTAIDEFSTKFDLSQTIWNKRINDTDHAMLCPCGICNGFGQNQFRGVYNVGAKVEKNNKYEYPGIHRSLL